MEVQWRVRAQCESIHTHVSEQRALRIRQHAVDADAQGEKGRLNRRLELLEPSAVARGCGDNVPWSDGVVQPGPVCLLGRLGDRRVGGDGVRLVEDEDLGSALGVEFGDNILYLPRRVARGR